MLDDRQSVRTKFGHNLDGQTHADALDRTGGQILIDGLFAHRHMAHHHVGLELLPIGGVAAPRALQFQTLTGSHAGHTAHHRDLSLVGAIHAEDGVAVFLVAEQQGGYGSLYAVLTS